MIKRVVIAGGGTGGHLFPGIAVLEELRRRVPNLEVLFVGTERGIEAKVVPEMGEQLLCLKVRPLKGRTPWELVRSLSLLPSAFLQAVRGLRAFRPDVVIGVGGYASGPALAAARMLGMPTCLLEQNAHVGLTNRILAKVVSRAYLSFASTASAFARHKVRLVGNPVRRAFVSLSQAALVDPEGFEARARKIFVVGGSQGSRALNQMVPAALSDAGVADSQFEIVHQTGRAMTAEVEATYVGLGINATVTPFIEDMAQAYSSAALVICRAGATTVAEICAVGRASILIPYPHAADDHQARNAQALEREGAALCVLEADLEPAGLSEAILKLLQDSTGRQAMAEAARGMGRPDAAAAIVDDLCGWLGEPDTDRQEGSLSTASVPEAEGADAQKATSGSQRPAVLAANWRSSRGPRAAGAYSPGVRNARRTWAAGSRGRRRPLVARQSGLK